MKPCQGNVLEPIRGSILVSSFALSQPPLASASASASASYLPPSKRKEQNTTNPVSLDLNSDTSFPTLSQMKPTTSGATWNQIRNRLNYKQVVEECIEREANRDNTIMESNTDATQGKNVYIAPDIKSSEPDSYFD